MSKKNLIIIGVALAAILIIWITFSNAKSKKTKDNIETSKVSTAETKYDEESGLYYVQDKETGEIIAAGNDASALKIYEDNPDYNPNPFEHREPITDLKAYRENLDLLYAEDEMNRLQEEY